jgi:hypothetical protein
MSESSEPFEEFAGLNDLNLSYAQIAQAGNVVEPAYSVSGTPGSLVFLS